MWLAIVLVCYQPDVTSCQVLAKNSELFPTLESCEKDAVIVSNYVMSQGAYSKWGCFKIGESA
jgi:hypothetical protein